MHNDNPDVQPVGVASAPKTAPATPLGGGAVLRRPPLDRTQSQTQSHGGGLGNPYAVASAVTAFKLGPQRYVNRDYKVHNSHLILLLLFVIEAQMHLRPLLLFLLEGRPLNGPLML